jgi:hypothetical protein
MDKNRFTAPESPLGQSSVIEESRCLTTWCGIPLTDLPREKLIEIIEQQARQISESRSPQNSRAYALGRIEMWKRGEA